MREHHQIHPRPVREASAVLQNRRDRVEEFAQDAQEHQARRGLARLRQKELEEAERHESEAEARDEAAARHQADLDIKQEHLRRQHTKETERRDA